MRFPGAACYLVNTVASAPESWPRPSVQNTSSQPFRAPLCLLLLAVAGCSEKAPRDFPLGLLNKGVLTRASQAGAAQAAGTLLDTSVDGLDAMAWRASQFVQIKPDFANPPAGAKVDGDSLQLGPESGGWLRLLDVQANTSLTLQAEFDGSGLDAQGNSARLAILEFEHSPTPGDWSDLTNSLQGAHFGAPYQESGPGTVSIWFHTSATTHSIALGVILSDEGADATGDRNLQARFRNFVLRPSTNAERISSLMGEKGDAQGVLSADFDVAMTRRQATVLGKGDLLTFPLDGFREENRDGVTFECSLGLVPGKDDPRDPANGAKMGFDVFLHSGLAGPPLASFELSSSSGTDSRWLPVTIDLSTIEEGAALSIRARSDLRAEDAPLGLVASPRIVPRIPRRAGPNIVLVSIDTLRADRMSLYGHDVETTPNIDAFARGALVFDDVWANGAYTLPSHMSLFTGQTPSMHTVQGPGRRRDPNRSPLLAETLADRGYTTAAFTGGGFVSPDFGFGASFESYGTVDPMVNSDSPLLRSQLANLADVDLALLEASSMSVVDSWLEQHQKESFFLFLHTYAPHQFDPQERHLLALGLGATLSDDSASQKVLYSMGEDVTEAEYSRVFELYDGAVRQADEGFGRLIQKLKSLDLLEDTIVILTSDHGKELGEHGAIGHGHALYQEMLSVPLVVRLPGRATCERGTWAPGRSATPVSLIDIVPTVLEALDIAPWPSLQGMSLLREIPDRAVMSEVQNLAVKYALREGQTKTIFSPLGKDLFIPNTIELESFDLSSDPTERFPLAVDSAEQAARIRAAFEEVAGKSLTFGKALDAAHIDADMRARLEALGYLEDSRREEERESNSND